MKRLMTVVSASVCAGLMAAEVPEAEVEETDEAAIFEAEFDFDFMSAYVWRNAIQNDRPVMQPCVWADLTALDPFWFGFSVWQNYDLTSRRRAVYPNAMNETDYNLHAGATAWESEEGDLSLEFEAGHDWYTYYRVAHDERSFYPDTRELYLKTRFVNPIVEVYGQVSWMYDDFGAYNSGLSYELGFKKEIELCESLTLGADWNVNFGDGNYLSFLYGDVNNKYDIEGNLVDADHPDVFGGTTFKVYLNWAVTDWMTLGATLAYTGILNGEIRDGDSDWGADNDLLWGGFSLKLAY